MKLPPIDLADNRRETIERAMMVLRNALEVALSEISALKKRLNDLEST